ncbi:methyltransferase dimerization domain-containing protein [Microbacterium sp.]|uniref:methyltransferase family protein n=1 Tax=Microbacterium sp. TaxID=51671 RepID=UPI002630A802|nr:methyltransferase dimerization domain-containing protein [Microbacterium sp.]MCV0332976.1 polyketide biosynthesis methyltransferase [Microbacterium sp.]MCV0375421.1 polyketide biosynthesis methyltransferase [Microbacterium sp.]MCV0389223.1 polyketide biosynthesis methyltransferase [Microbacterium sp.]MCV0417751.1 polyketide biosynthesis methyltransferase [Microbacterium sp.]MCV0421063.1 polyketide biosynthesis methyltransferase [Microbacterium sp.]
MTDTPTADAARILDIATGYMASKQLFHARRIGLFAAVDGGADTVPAIAERCGVSERIAHLLADAMTAQGLLVRTDGHYALAPDAAAYLTGADAAIDLGPFLTFLDEISYPHWLQFAHTVDTTEPGDLRMDDARWATFMAGVMTYNRLHAQEFGRHIDLAGATKALDFGGLSADFALSVMAQNPALHTTFVYAPGFEDGIAEAVAAAGVADRVVEIADTATAAPEGAYDAVFANHVIHRFTAEENARIFRNLRAAATPGATLTVLDFFLDDDAEQRGIDARHAGEYLVIDGTVVYPESQVRGWLNDAGWEVRDKVALPGSPRVLVATAV